jgi:hypothetical protein
MFRLFASHSEPVPVSLTPLPYTSPINPHLLHDFVEPDLVLLQSCVLPFEIEPLKIIVNDTKKDIVKRKRPSQKKRLILHKQKRGDIPMPEKNTRVPTFTATRSDPAWKKKQIVVKKKEVIVKKNMPIKKVAVTKDVVKTEIPAIKKVVQKKASAKVKKPTAKKVHESMDDIPDYIPESSDVSSFM